MRTMVAQINHLADIPELQPQSAYATFGSFYIFYPFGAISYWNVALIVANMERVLKIFFEKIYVNPECYPNYGH